MAVLLFLILFAILFPKALRFLFLLLFICLIVALGQANAEPVRCLLRVDGRTYINKICNGEFDKNGFDIGGEKRGSYFANMRKNDNGTMTGYWNGVDAESHAHESLGILLESGECWVNSHARVCAVPTRTKSGLCVGDYSIESVDGHFVAKSLSNKNCPAITIDKDKG